MRLTFLFLIAAACGTLFAQSRFVEVQPKRTRDYDERRDNGYCVVRLRVDDEVVVHIRGNRLGFETVRGREAHDEGSECSQPMPRGSALDNFRFRGVDGRGRVDLAEAPDSGNRFTARVRIQDSKGGDEGYTFRVQWDNRNPGMSAESGGWQGWGGAGNRPGSGSGWGSGANQGSGWGTGSTAGTGSGWGSGSGSATGWWQNDFEATTRGAGVARMAGQPDLNLTSTVLRLRRNGQFTLEILGAETVRFAGSWTRNGDTAVLTVRNGFANGGATGSGNATILNNEVQSLTLDGRNRQTNATFNVQFRSGVRGRRLR
ncbi:MAG: hypothetical protein IH602_03780 [Bryobacteraceae bacterium]|nr:hypothetical protein [Bryobacteraceae bacterium]